MTCIPAICLRVSAPYGTSQTPHLSGLSASPQTCSATHSCECNTSRWTHCSLSCGAKVAGAFPGQIVNCTRNEAEKYGFECWVSGLAVSKPLNSKLQGLTPKKSENPGAWGPSIMANTMPIFGFLQRPVNSIYLASARSLRGNLGFLEL